MSYDSKSYEIELFSTLLNLKMSENIGANRTKVNTPGDEWSRTSEHRFLIHCFNNQTKYLIFESVAD